MMKKRKFGSGGMPSIEESLKSGNRVSEQVGKETKKLMPPKKRTMPSPGESVKSGNRMSGEDAKDLKAVKKYAAGGNVAAFNPTQALNAFSADLARRVKSGAMTTQQAQQAQSQFRNQVQLNTKTPPTRQGAEGIARGIMQGVMAPPQAPRSGLLGGLSGGPPRQMRTPTPGGPVGPPMPLVGPPPMAGGIGGIGAPKTGFQNPPSMRLTAPTGPAPAGPPTTPAAAARMKKGGKVAKPPVKKMAKGGSVSSRGDGCAVRGKTKGKMV